MRQGQFMLRTRNPFATVHGGRFADAKPNRFFMAEIDVLWDEQPAEADRILREYVALGGTHLLTGPVWAHGYDGHFPATNWLGRVERFAAFLRWVASHGVFVTLVVGPDNAPYYDDRARTFDRAAIERDLTPFYAALRATGAMPTRVVSQWEQWQDTAESGWLFDWMARVFPTEERVWHNPPNHLGPGPSDMSEAATAAHAVAHGIQAWAYQADPYGGGDGRTSFQQMQYDLADLVRRSKGYAGWPQGFRTYYAEGTAHPMYHHDAPQALAAEWGTGALVVPGLLESWDGIPSAVSR